MHTAKSIVPTLGIMTAGVLMSPAMADAQLRRSRLEATGKSVTFNHDGRSREYRIHVPDGIQEKEDIPLVVCLHGGGGNADQGSAMGLTTVADRHGFIVVYPNAIDKHWNDGRDSKRFAEHDRKIDDVSFVIAIVDRVKQDFNIDEDRVFCTGPSNGGFMTQRLAIEKSDVFSAVGIIIASMATPLKDKFEPQLPVSVMFLNGTDDPLVPYAGGEVQVNLFPRLNRLRNQPNLSRGTCLHTDDAVKLWLKRNQIKSEPKVTKLPDKDTSDGSTVEVSLWKGGQRGTAVALYKVIGGGHTLPGRPQWTSERLVGKTNRDIDGFEEIWKFFTEHARETE